MKAIFFAVFFLAFFPEFSWAASCCAGSGGQTITVLPAEESYQFGASFSFRSIEGHFDPYGFYGSLSKTDYSETYTTIFGGAYRLGEAWQVAASLPVVNRRETYSETSNSTTGLGDIVLEGRFTLWDDLFFLIRPSLDFYAGMRLPTGTSVYTSNDPTGIDAVGDGVWTPYIGASVSKMVRPFRFGIDGSYSRSFSKTVSQNKGTDILPYSTKPGNKIKTSETISWLANLNWSVSLGLHQLWQSEASMNGEQVSGSAARSYSSSLGVALSDGNWRFSIAYEAIFPFYPYVVNQPNFGALSASIIFAGI